MALVINVLVVDAPSRSWGGLGTLGTSRGMGPQRRPTERVPEGRRVGRAESGRAGELPSGISPKRGPFP